MTSTNSSPPHELHQRTPARAAPRPRAGAAVDALAALDAQLPIRVPVVVGGDRRDAPTFESTDPGAPDRVVALATSATTADVDAAVRAASAAAPAWEERGAHARAAILSRAAGELRRRRSTLAALAVRECAKPWAEADADVCEAIDFLEYYAQQAIALEGSGGLVQLPGERNTIRYAARGVVAVIGPWNFPLAIPCGMVAAGLATGNGVVLKPAEQSPACAHAVVEALHAGGRARGRLNLLPGEGDVGAALVAHPGVHTIAFTGSGAVGLEILHKSRRARPGQRHLKRVVAEMGGKNCVIVDADADLDDVVPALAYSAFGFAGQKCSAASRALVHERIADALLERLHGAVEALLVDQAQRFGVDEVAVARDVEPLEVAEQRRALDQGMFLDRVTTLSPSSAEIGMNVMSRTRRRVANSLELVADLVERVLREVDQVHLVDAQTRCGTPSSVARNAWRRLCSVMPLRASSRISATSAVEAPVTMLRVYWMCPGVSAMMNFRRGVAK